MVIRSESVGLKSRMTSGAGGAAAGAGALCAIPTTDAASATDPAIISPAK